MGTDKASLELGGITLLQRAIGRLAGVCDPVLIAAGDLPIAVANHRSVADASPRAGPIGGLVAALRATPHRLLTAVAVDLVWLDPLLIRLLAERIGDHDAAVCETARGIEPLHAVYATSILEEAEAALAGPDRSLRALIGRARAIRVAESEWRAAGISDRFARNINTPDELAEVRREIRR
jgi:molybdenum cofactor guanylyltransferase